VGDLADDLDPVELVPVGGRREERRRPGLWTPRYVSLIVYLMFCVSPGATLPPR